MKSVRASTKAAFAQGEEAPTPTISNKASPNHFLPPLSLDHNPSSKIPNCDSSLDTFARFSSPTVEPIEMKRPRLDDPPISLSPYMATLPRPPTRLRKRNKRQALTGTDNHDNISLSCRVHETAIDVTNYGDDSFWKIMVWHILPYCLACDLVKTPVPWRLLQRTIRALWKRAMKGPAMIPTPLQLSTKPVTHRAPHSKPSFSNTPELRQGTIQGIPNFGQTCFMNSVLQSLASLEPFLAYLDRIHQVHVDQSALSPLSNPECFADQLLQLLLATNGIQIDSVVTSHNRLRIDPRQLLRRVGQSNAQFRRRGEQQDAQEYLQALLGVVISEAQLDSITAASDHMCFIDVGISEEPLTAVMAGVEANGSTESLFQVEDARGVGALSLSNLLERIDKDRKAILLQPTMNGKIASISTLSTTAEENVAETSGLSLEEKKQEDFEILIPMCASEECLEDLANHTITSFQIQNGRTSSKLSETSWEKSENQSTAMKIVQSTISSITPSPLSGWLGSTIQCCNCQHVRPIRNTPFFDIPLVPTSVPAYLSGTDKNGPAPNSYPLPACSIEQCLAEFTSVERVQDVECRFCTIQAEIVELKEEEMLLNGAIESTEKRIRTKGGDSSAETKSLKEELGKAQLRLVKLQTMDPDEDDLELFDSGSKEDFFVVNTTSPNKPNRLVRCDARKCLFLTRCPSILCCHIQRRYYDPYTNRMEKCVQHVEFEEVLNLAPYCAYSSEARSGWVAGSSGSNTRTERNKKMMYRLESIIEHRGNAHGGHYVCYRRFGASWFRISDSIVTPVSWKQVRSCQAYMLFYEAM